MAQLTGTVGLALGSGAARGGAHIGVIRALLARGKWALTRAARAMAEAGG
jgi:predicted acylesterase/phospholipase RssA